MGNGIIRKDIEDEIDRKLLQLSELRARYDANDFNNPHDQGQAAMAISNIVSQIDLLRKLLEKMENHK